MIVFFAVCMTYHNIYIFCTTLKQFLITIYRDKITISNSLLGSQMEKCAMQFFLIIFTNFIISNSQ